MSERNTIGDDLGALLWRRYYATRATLDQTVTILPETLHQLLVQAGVPEPDDDVILWDGRPVHGKTLAPVGEDRDRA